MGTLYRQIVSLENLLAAWREFRKSKRRKPDVAQFEFNIEDNLFGIHKQLRNFTYTHHAYQSFYIHDPKRRHIHKASVRDRVVHQAVFRTLYPIFDNQFIFDSYSCRIKKGTHRAVDRLDALIHRVTANHRCPAYAMKCDIVRFFDSIDHKILARFIKKKIQDEQVLWLIQKILESYGNEIKKGLPLGNVTSQLFANIYLDPLDHFVKHKLGVKCYLRYCDDFIFLHREPTILFKFVEGVKAFLKANLSLSIHESKIHVRKCSQGIDFLGYVLLPHHRVLRTRTKKRMFRKFKERRLQMGRKQISHKSLYQSFQSYCGVLEHCHGYKIKKEMVKIYSESQFL